MARSWWLLLLCTSGLIVAVESLTLRLPLTVAVVLALGFAATLFLITIVHRGRARDRRRSPWPSADRDSAFLAGWRGVLRVGGRAPGQQALSLAAGPGANLALGLLAALAAFLPLGEISQIGCGFLAALSLLYGLLNLVPIYPQDGGQILQAVLWKLTADPTRARRITSTLSVWLASIVMAAGPRRRRAGQPDSGAARRGSGALPDSGKRAVGTRATGTRAVGWPAIRGRPGRAGRPTRLASSPRPAARLNWLASWCGRRSRRARPSARRRAGDAQRDVPGRGEVAAAEAATHGQVRLRPATKSTARTSSIYQLGASTVPCDTLNIAATRVRYPFARRRAPDVGGTTANRESRAPRRGAKARRRCHTKKHTTTPERGPDYVVRTRNVCDASRRSGGCRSR